MATGFMILLFLGVLAGVVSAYAFYRLGAFAGSLLVLLALLLSTKGVQQMKGNAARSGLLFSAVLFIALIAQGCASSPGGISPTSQLKEGVTLANFPSLSVEVTSAADVPLAAPERDRIANLIIGKIRKEDPSRFKDINAAPPSPSTLRASVNITRYEKGNAFARFMLAGLGQIHIDAQLVLEDQEKQESLATYAVTKTFAWGGIYGVSTRIDDVEEGFASTIAALLLGKEEK